MNTDMFMEKIVQSLSLEVKAIPNDNFIQLTNSSTRTPLKLKVKVRKKDIAVTNNCITTSKRHSKGATVNNIHLADSNQTIMSFDIFMETDQALLTKKPRNKFFQLLRPGMCLGNIDDEKESYKSSKSQNSSVISKSEIGWKRHLSLSKKDYLDLSTINSKKHQHFLGKCKPGGCLDPPFSEDKYSYTPIQKEKELPPPRLNINNLYVGNNIRILSEEDSVTKTLSKEKLSRHNMEANKKQQPRINSILNLYQAESRNTSLSITYSNSIITYPPPLTTSEIELNNENSIQHRFSPDYRSIYSCNELSESYLTSPKELNNYFGHADYLQKNLRPTVKQNLVEQIFCMKNDIVSEIQNIDDMSSEVSKIIEITKNEKSKELTNTSQEPSPGINNISRSLDGDNYLNNNGNVEKTNSKKQLPEDTTLNISTTHEFKAHDTTKSMSDLIKNAHFVLQSSIRSCLAEQNLNVYNSLSEQLVQKESIILTKLDASLSLLKDNTKSAKEKCHEPNIFKSDSYKLNDPDKILKSTILSKEGDDLNKSHLLNNYSNKFDTAISALKNSVDSEVSVLDPVLKKSQETIDANAEKDRYCSDTSALIKSDKLMYIPAFNYTLNENGLNNNTDIKPEQIKKNELPFELKYQQKVDIVKNSHTNLDLNNKEIPTYNLSNTFSETDYDKKEVEKRLIKDIIIHQNVLESNEIITQSDINKKNENTSKNIDNRNVFNQDGQKSLNKLDNNKLCPESTRYFVNDASLNRNSHIDSKNLFSALALVRKNSKNYKAELENFKQNKLNFNEIENRTKKDSQVNTGIEKAYGNDIKTPSYQTEDVSNTFTPLVRITSSHGSITDHVQDIVFLNTEKVATSIKKDNDQIAKLNENFEENYIELTMREVAKDQPQSLLDDELFTVNKVTDHHAQHSLHDTEKEFKNYGIKDGNMNSPKDQFVIWLFEEIIKSLEETHMIHKKLFNADFEIEAKEISINLLDVDDTEINKQTFNKAAVNHHIYLDLGDHESKDIAKMIGFHDTEKQNMSQNTNVKSIDQTIFKYSPEKAEKTQIAESTDRILTNTKNYSMNAQISNNFDLLTETAEAEKYDPIETTEIKVLKTDPSYEQGNTTSLISSMLIDEHYTSADAANIKNNKSYIKTSKIAKQSTIYDVGAFPYYAKKLKKDIAHLKDRSVLYTPSENTMTKAVKKNTITVDLAFHSYVNDKNEKIVKTFDSEKEPQRNPDDRVIILKSDISLSQNVIKIPIDYENHLVVKLKKANELDHTQHHAFKEVNKMIDREMDATKIGTRNPDDYKILNLDSIYDSALLPLQNAIKGLKDEIDYLGHKLILKDKLHTRKLKLPRLAHNSTKCVCLKRLF